MSRQFEMTSRRATTGDHRRVGSRGEGTQTNPHAEIIRLPAGSIVSIPRLEPIYLAESRLKEALLFALPFGLFLWICIALVIRALFF